MGPEPAGVLGRCTLCGGIFLRDPSLYSSKCRRKPLVPIRGDSFPSLIRKFRTLSQNVTYFAGFQRNNSAFIRVATQPGKLGESGKVRKFVILPKNQGKVREFQHFVHYFGKVREFENFKA